MDTIDTFYNCPKCNLKTVNVQQKIGKRGGVSLEVKKCANKACREQTGLKQIIEHDKKLNASKTD